MKKAKIVGLWILSIFFILSAMVYFPSFSSLISVLIVALVIPISKWQAILNKYIKGKLKLIIVIILALVTMFTAPNTEANAPDDTTATTTTEASTDSTVESTSETTAASTTESTTTPTTEPTTAPTTEPTTEPTTAPTTEPTTAPTTEPTTAPTTEPPHTHSFSSATCTAPKTCSCGATEGEANGHSWKNATCQAPKTCITCGITEGTTADHSWSAATCTAPQKCKTCSAENGSAIGHNYNQGTCLICGSKDPDYVEITYVLNTYTMKFHRPSCRKLPTDNRKDTSMSREEVIAAGYDACGICHP